MRMRSSDVWHSKDCAIHSTFISTTNNNGAVLKIAAAVPRINTLLYSTTIRYKTRAYIDSYPLYMKLLPVCSVFELPRI